MAILFIVFYVYAITGVTLFKGNDPKHFKNLHVAMLTMFQVSTMDNWNEIMYINVYGCDKFGYEEGGFLDAADCTDPKAYPVIAVFFFVTFTICSSMVLLSLFLGVVSISMEHQKVEYAMREYLAMEAGEVAADRGLDKRQLQQFALAFALVDVDGSNEIDEDEITFMLEAGNPDEEISETDVITKMQQLHLLDGKDEVTLNFPEFITFMMTVKEEKEVLEEEKRRVEQLQEEAKGRAQKSPGGSKWGVVRRHLSTESDKKRTNTVLSTWKAQAIEHVEDSEERVKELKELVERVKAGDGDEEEVADSIISAMDELQKILLNTDSRFSSNKDQLTRLKRGRSFDHNNPTKEKARGAAGAAVGSLNINTQHMAARARNAADSGASGVELTNRSTVGFNMQGRPVVTKGKTQHGSPKGGFGLFKKSGSGMIAETKRGRSHTTSEPAAETIPEGEASLSLPNLPDLAAARAHADTDTTSNAIV
jgi:Ca2+-binding EF-hand superfamily protein